MIFLKNQEGLEKYFQILANFIFGEKLFVSRDLFSAKIFAGANLFVERMSVYGLMNLIPIRCFNGQCAYRGAQML